MRICVYTPPHPSVLSEWRAALAVSRRVFAASDRICVRARWGAKLLAGSHELCGWSSTDWVCWLAPRDWSNRRHTPNVFATKCFQPISTTTIHTFLRGTVMMVFVSTEISTSHTCFCAQSFFSPFFVQTYNDAEISTHWKSVVTPSRNLSKNCLAQLFQFCIAIRRHERRTHCAASLAARQRMPCQKVRRIFLWLEEFDDSEQQSALVTPLHYPFPLWPC